MQRCLFLLYFLFIAGIFNTVYSEDMSCLDRGDSNIYFCDPLIVGSTTGSRNGGEFVSEGFKIINKTDNLFYDLGDIAYKGRFSFWVKNIKLSSLEYGDNHHLFEGRSIDSCNWQLPDYYLSSLRIYSKQGENEPIFGHIKFEYGAVDPCGGEKMVPDWDYSNWQEEKWYHIEMEFDTEYGRLMIDGDEKSRIDLKSADCSVGYRYLYLPIKSCVPSVEGVNEAIYAYVSFAGYGADEPIDAGFDTVADIFLPDAGGNYEVFSVIEDHSVHKWESNIHPSDETVLDVEGDSNGDFNEGFYLKFKVDNIPDGYEADEAVVFLYCDYLQYPDAAGGGGGDIYFVENNDWSENTITWENKPSFNLHILDSQGSINRGNWYKFDVSSVVKENGTYSFAVMSRSNDGGHYLSKEGGMSSGKTPYLMIHLTPKAQSDIVEDTGCVECRDVVISDVITDLPDFRHLDIISEELAFDNGCLYCDDITGVDTLSDAVSEAGLQDSQRDSGTNSDESSGCGCNLLN